MRIEDVVLVAAIREGVRSSPFIHSDTAKVTQAVLQAALAGKLPRNEGYGDFSRGAKQGTSSTTAALPVGAKQEDDSGVKLFVSSGSVGLRRKSLATVNNRHSGQARV